MIRSAARIFTAIVLVLLVLGGCKGHFSVVGLVQIDGFHCTADTQIVTAVLVIQNVAPLQGGLAQIVDELLLLKRQLLKTLYTVAQNFQIIEFVHVVSEFVVVVFGCLLFAAGQTYGRKNNNGRQKKCFFHRLSVFGPLRAEKLLLEQSEDIADARCR